MSVVPTARIVSAATVTVVLAGGVVPYAQDVAPGLSAFLRQHLRMSAADIAESRDGRAVITVLDAADPREIAAAGVVRVNAPPRAFVESVLDVATYMRGGPVHQAGAFSAPPVLSDLDAVTLPDADLEALRACRVGRCGVKLPAALLERLQQEVWSAPDWRQQVSARVKQWILDGARTYLQDGYAALPEYVDQRLAVSVADETRAMVSALPYVRDQAPEFLERLGRPRDEAPLAGMTRVLYWAVEHHGFKPTLTISEAAVYQRDAPAGPVFVATTQLYATHYFEGVVTFTVATPAGSGRSTAFDLLYFHHARIDSLRGGFRGLKRFSAGRRIRPQLEAMLLANKRHVERQATNAMH